MTSVGPCVLLFKKRFWVFSCRL